MLIEIFALIPGTGIDVAVEYKNVEDTNWTTFGSAISASSTGVHTLQVTGIKEEVRLRFSVNGTSPNDIVYANVLAPQWID